MAAQGIEPLGMKTTKDFGNAGGRKGREGLEWRKGQGEGSACLLAGRA